MIQRHFMITKELDEKLGEQADEELTSKSAIIRRAISNEVES